MNWTEAVAAMKRGKHVYRTSQQKRELVSNSGGIPVYDRGTEPMRLAAAWTSDGKPVSIFQGAYSKSLFIPEPEHMDATDWEVSDD